MSDIMYTSSNIAGIPQFTKSKLLDIYIRTNESLQTNVELLQKIPNMVELAQTYFLSCLNAAIGHNITLHCLSDDNVIYAFCFVQLKGICNNKPYYKLSSLTVNPDFRESHYEKKLINNIIERFSPESGCIYGFVPKAFKGASIYFSSLYEHNELCSVSDDFPEDPTSWLDDNGKIQLPIDVWNCFWYPKRPISQ